MAEDWYTGMDTEFARRLKAMIEAFRSKEIPKEEKESKMDVIINILSS